MNPLQPAKMIRLPVKQFIADMMSKGFTRRQAKDAYQVSGGECWKNDLYTVLVKRKGEIPEDMNPLGLPLVWLSIRRNDREPATDWRHFQQIKNELVGSECEGVEIFPAESRLVDSANQYHVFALATPDFRFPFGFGERMVDDTIQIGKSRQRPFEKGDTHP